MSTTMDIASGTRDPQICYAPGQLPLFWDRSVVFFANLLALFFGNREAIKELATQVGQIETYGGRLCPLINLLFRGPDNLLVLEREPDARLLKYFTDDLGLTIPPCIILPHKQYLQLPERLIDANRCLFGNDSTARIWQQIAEHPADWIDGFVTDAILMATATAFRKQTLVSSEASRLGNNKLLVHRFLQQQGFPVFDTYLAEAPSDIVEAAAALRAQGYPRIVVKSQIGASGIGMLTLDADRPDVQRVLDHWFFEGPCLVQGWLDEQVSGLRRLGSPSMQMFLDETSVNLYDVTEQILSAESVHQGNIAPPPYWQTMQEVQWPLREQSEAVGRWLHQHGYRGTASADFLVVQRDQRLDVILCEVNARVTGATYPAVLARHFCPGGTWLMRNLVFDPPVASEDLLATLNRAGYLFLAGHARGVLPINFNPGPCGRIRKGQFLCLGSEQDGCIADLNQSAQLLPVAWDYDRD
jgi:hypothetical protein